MKVSIIVPIYNIKEYLPKCLDSILSQTYMDFEAVLVDDGSTDGSSQIVDDYVAKDARFIPLHKQNGGLVRAWHDGVKNANGEYLLFIDGDDYFDKDALKNLMIPVVKHNVDMSIGNFYYDNTPNGGSLTQHQNHVEVGLYEGEKLLDIYRSIIPKYGNYLSPSRCGKLIRKTVFEENLKYSDPSISSAEDVNIMLPVMFSCKSVYCSEVNVFYYVKRGTSISHTLKPNFLDGYIRLIEVLSKVIADKQLSFNAEIDNLYNVYGNLWFTYVDNSTLSYKEKNQQMNRIFEHDGFKANIHNIHISSGPSCMAYKYAVRLNCPSLYLQFKRLHSIIRH